jgi:hypothetical protein
MKRLKIIKSYAVLALFIYFLVYSNIDAMATFFFATLTFNLAVLTILVIGIIVILRSTMNLVMLAGTFGILAYKKDNLTFYLQGIDKIMPANIAHMFHSRAEKGVLLFTSEESRTVVEWIDEKFSHQNRYINYFISTSLMIGLLGTFTGLLVSIDQMGKIILSLSGDIDLGEVIRGFAGPLGGMAIGFGSSLFGVVSAIILGIMGYILNKNQEQLIEGVEDWLKGRIIDSGGATVSAGVPGASAGAELPEHRSSFMDVFIDNIASLTKEMAKISLTNERLHTITIASVQQTRDEHEVNFELFESMNNNLSSIAKTLSTNSEQLGDQSEQMSLLLTTLDTNLKEQLTLLNSIESSQQSANAKVDESRERLEALREELQTISSILSKNEERDAQSTQELLSSVSAMAEKLQGEITLLESLEKLNKLQITDARKQTSIIESLEKSSSLTEQNGSLITEKLTSLESLLGVQTQTQEKSLLTQDDSKELLEKQRVILELLIGKNDENLSELRRISTGEKASSTTTATTTQKSGFFSKIFG